MNPYRELENKSEIEENHSRITWFLLILMAANITFFLVMWLHGWSQFEDIGADICQKTFSDIIMTYQPIKITFCVWLGLYGISLTAIITLLFKFDLKSYYQVRWSKEVDRWKDGQLTTTIKAVKLDNPYLKNNKHTFRAIKAISILYTLLTISKLIGLVLVAVWDTEGVDSSKHQVAAKVAFISAILCSLLLVIRRGIITAHQYIIYATEDALSVDLENRFTKIQTGSYLNPIRETNTATANRIKIILVILIISLLVTLAELLTAIFFIAGSPCPAALEFTLTLLILIDIGWEVVDFYFDPVAMEKHFGKGGEEGEEKENINSNQSARMMMVSI